jgi:hypothetical protein
MQQFCGILAVGNPSRRATKEMKIMFSIRHTAGSGEVNPPVEAIYALYDELLTADQEHGDVSVANEESGWCMSAHRDGRVVFGNLKDYGRSDRHMIPVSKERVLELWKRLIDGDIDGLLKEPWKEGYGTLK